MILKMMMIIELINYLLIYIEYIKLNHLLNELSTLLHVSSSNLSIVLSVSSLYTFSSFNYKFKILLIS